MLTSALTCTDYEYHDNLTAADLHPYISAHNGTVGLGDGLVTLSNIAETSLTINGVRVVIDAGLARVPRFDPGRGMTRLDTQRISRASATQRAGRSLVRLKRTAWRPRRA